MGQKETCDIVKEIIPRCNGDVRGTPGFFRLPEELAVDVGNFKDYCLAAFEERMRKKGVRIKRVGNAPHVHLLRGAFLPEAYSLDVRPDGILLSAADERGIILGLTTLYEALAHSAYEHSVKETPCFTLRDKPRYTHRGFMLDCARHFFESSEIERLIEEMSLVKLNVFHWHLSDDQGWRIESEAFPGLNEKNEHYTKDEIRHITAFAKERGIEVVPEIDMPGHTTALLSAYPELSCKGEPVEQAKGGGIYKTILCAGKENVYSFLYGLLDEVCALFESQRIHLGGDEAPRDAWEACEDCREALRKNNLANFDDLQTLFTARLAAHLAENGKRVICWNDVLKTVPPPRAIDIQYWIEWGQERGLQSFFDSGGRVVFSDMFNLYFDYPESFTPLSKVYHYEPHIGGKDCADADNAAGLEGCLWTERVETPAVLEKKLFPRLFALAEAAWSREKDYPDFERRLLAKLRHLTDEGIAFTMLQDCNPSGARREDEIAEFWKEFAQFTSSAGSPRPEMLQEMMGVMVRGFNVPSSSIPL